jgi:ubiquinone/menaquinone biosynthesis C-methylase UbiE
MKTFLMEDVRAFWDSVADIYEDENEKISEVHNQRFTEAMKYLEVSKGKNILNIWSRDGGAISYLRELNNSYFLVNCELSQNMIKISKKKFPRELFVECSLHEFPFSDERFDCVLSLETLEHVPEPELFLEEVRRVLNRGGRLVMSTPPSTAEIIRKIYELFFTDHGEGPHKFRSSHAVKRMLSKSGFKLINHRGTVFMPIDYPFFRKTEQILDPFLQIPFVREFGIRQFYVATKE